MIKAGKFWLQHPALLYGLTLLLGTLFALQSPLALLPFLLLLSRKHVLPLTLLFLLPLAYLHHLHTFPPSGTSVSGTLHIQSVRKTTRFGPGWSYRGVLKTANGRLYCQLHSKTYHKADRDYTLDGTITTRNERYYTLKPTSWEARPSLYRLAHLRMEAKTYVKNYIERHIKEKRAAHFLTGMVTGQLEDRVMMQEFGNLGLSHIMAISGFHFALLTFAIHLVLRLFLPHKLEAALLMLLLTLYLLFIGDSPSIQRAWCVAMVFLLGQLLERPSTPLNSLGVALILAITLNPLSATTLSFQLSFLATAGILLFYRPLSALLQTWLPHHPFSEVLQRPLLWQHGYLCTTLFREAFALTTAVHIALLPLLLTVFHSFSLNSLIYNLFFPFCASLALLLFLLSVVTGGSLHLLNNWYCTKLLSLTEHPPIYLKTLYVEHFSPLLGVMYLTLLFFLTIRLESREEALIV